MKRSEGSSRRYVVTGGLGMIGSALVRLLLARGHEVFVIDDLSRGRLANLGGAGDHGSLRVAYGDAASGVVWDWNVPVDPIDGIFHLAAIIGGVGKMYAEPYGQARNCLVDFAVAEQARRREVGRVVYASTACVYPTFLQTEEQAGLLLKEEQVWPARPESLYGLLKLAGEEMFRALSRQHGCDVVSVRMFNAVGPEHCPIPDRHVVPALLGKLARGDDRLDVWGDGRAERSFLDARDAATALLLVMESGEAGTAYNVGAETRYSVAEIARHCVAASGRDVEIVFDPSRPAGVHTRASDLTRIRRLGWEPEHRFDAMVRHVWSELR